MCSARLSRALDEGVFALPDEGTIALLAPKIGDDLSALPKGRLRLFVDVKPDYDYFTAQGYHCVRGESGLHAMAIIFAVRARQEMRGLVARACAMVPAGAFVVVDGQKTDGIDALHKEIRVSIPVTGMLAKAHGKLFCFAAGPMFETWQPCHRPVEGGFVTRPGVFSADGPDPASVLLAQTLPAKLPPCVIDLGAGWGYLSRHILQREGVKILHLVEANINALDCAQHNINDPRACFHWEDALSWRAPSLAGAVVCNPPFHRGRTADIGLGIGFIRAATRFLASDGALWLVVNRHLPYDESLHLSFGDVQDMGGDTRFRVICARYPNRLT